MKAKQEATFKGKTKSITQWAKEYAVDPRIIRHRLRLGWEFERALTTPVNFCSGHVKINIGQRFGRLVVVKKTDQQDKKGQFLYECLCDCGKTRLVNSTSLRNGDTKSCRCHKAELARERKSYNLEGKRFGRLTAIKRVSKKREDNRHTYWECKCDCGNIIQTLTYCLTSGMTRSCGCLSAERSSNWMSKLHTNNEKLGFVENTFLGSLKTGKSSRSNTGELGVHRIQKTGKYHAQIKFKGKSYNLGYYYTLKEATMARRRAEEEFFEPVL